MFFRFWLEWPFMWNTLQPPAHTYISLPPSPSSIPLSLTRTHAHTNKLAQVLLPERASGSIPLTEPSALSHILTCCQSQIHTHTHSHTHTHTHTHGFSCSFLKGKEKLESLMKYLLLFPQKAWVLHFWKTRAYTHTHTHAHRQRVQCFDGVLCTRSGIKSNGTFPLKTTCACVC